MAGILGASNILEGGSSSSSSDLTGGAIQPSQSATDYSEINELAEDEAITLFPPPLLTTVTSVVSINAVRSSALLDEDDNYDDDGLNSEDDAMLPEEETSRRDTNAQGMHVCFFCRNAFIHDYMLTHVNFRSCRYFNHHFLNNNNNNSCAYRSS